MNSQSKKQGLIWGGLLILFGALMLIETMTNLSAFAWVGILAAAGLGAFAIYLTDRSDWGLLIPAYVLWSIAALVALVTLDILHDELIATFVLAVIALPFLVGFLRDRSRWGLLIPAYILLAVGIMVALIGLSILDDLLIPAYVLLSVSVPFFVVYVRNRKQWWPLIPGGITAIIGLSFLIAENIAQYVGAIALVVVGSWILVRQFTRQEPAGQEPAGQEPAGQEPAGPKSADQEPQDHEHAGQEPTGAESDGPPAM
ncbi:MAG: hypothetical protein JXA89_22625 [Anaerolineae bacterium]|nr:hypothetical protein [Anaerolineae bacterium]